MKIKTLASIAAAVMTGALFGETTVEGIGVGSDGFWFKKTCIGTPETHECGIFPDGFAVSSIADATNAVAKGYVVYDLA